MKIILFAVLISLATPNVASIETSWKDFKTNMQKLFSHNTKMQLDSSIIDPTLNNYKNTLNETTFVVNRNKRSDESYEDNESHIEKLTRREMFAKRRERARQMREKAKAGLRSIEDSESYKNHRVNAQKGSRGQKKVESEGQDENSENNESNESISIATTGQNNRVTTKPKSAENSSTKKKYGNRIRYTRKTLIENETSTVTKITQNPIYLKKDKNKKTSNENNDKRPGAKRGVASTPSQEKSRESRKSNKSNKEPSKKQGKNNSGLGKTTEKLGSGVTTASRGVGGKKGTNTQEDGGSKKRGSEKREKKKLDK